MPVVEQVGGAHYAAPAGWGHWDLMERCDVSYLEATATKYVVRWRTKGGVEDLRKALSYLRKMGDRGARRLVPADDLNRFALATSAVWEDMVVVSLILGQGHGRPGDIHRAIAEIEHMIEKREQGR